jgi:SAM-dependent methyltransferase
LENKRNRKMSEQLEATDADRTLKARHRAMWGLGDYPTVAAEVIPDLGARLVAACGVGPGDRVLDVAAGSGNAAIPAAMAGAKVVASDLTPALFEAGRRQAAFCGVDIDWREADAEALPFADGEFDAVLSCVGVMFAPHHRASADQLIRVCRPGGKIGLVSWTPDGFIGQMLATMRPYVAAPPPGAQPPPLWGDPDHVKRLLGDRVTDVRAVKETVRVDRFGDPEEFRDYFKARYGPMVAAYRGLAEDPERAVALDRDLADLARRHNRSDDAFGMDWEYLLLTARTVV